MNELIDITNSIKPDENSNYCNDDEALEFYETCIHIMDEFINNNPKIITEHDFDDIFDDNIKELIEAHFENDIFYTEEVEEEMEDIIEQAKKDFFQNYYTIRSYDKSIILKEPDFQFVKKQIRILTEKPQPTQRTKEWYEFRHNLITASNAYKAFESQANQNQLIFEKCQPLNPSMYVDTENTEIKEVIMVNTNSTLHWGQKYEPLSVLYYEYMYETRVSDFGCIQHDTYKFIGASPDGINTDPKSKRYGRMLEIKNIVNREIDGIPKKEYWIQMQLQMEVCGLNECDFLETRFTEYVDKEAYYDDTCEDKFETEDGCDFTNNCIAKDDKMKGIIMYFHTKEGKPLYIYKPLNIEHPEDVTKWEETHLELYQSEPYNYTYMKFIYWKLAEVSCVLVCRNKRWFQDNVNEIKQLWSIIEKERIEGYEHRAPNRKQKKDGFDMILEKICDVNNNNSNNSNCLLHFDKNTGKITVVKKEMN